MESRTRDNPPVRFGGRGEVITSSLPIFRFSLQEQVNLTLGLRVLFSSYTHGCFPSLGNWFDPWGGRGNRLNRPFLLGLGPMVARFRRSSFGSRWKCLCRLGWV